MKRISMSLIAAMIVMITSCEKQEINPDRPVIKENLKECRTCEGHWDIDGTTP